VVGDKTEDMSRPMRSVSEVSGIFVRSHRGVSNTPGTVTRSGAGWLCRRRGLDSDIFLLWRRRRQ